MVNPWSDERQRNRQIWPRPFGLRRKFGHTSLPASTVGPATAFGRPLDSTPRTKNCPRGPRCLAEFTLATPSTPIVLTGPRLGHAPKSGRALRDEEQPADASLRTGRQSDLDVSADVRAEARTLHTVTKRPPADAGGLWFLRRRRGSLSAKLSTCRPCRRRGRRPGLAPWARAARLPELRWSAAAPQSTLRSAEPCASPWWGR